jgi:hypothetical protein
MKLATTISGGVKDDSGVAGELKYLYGFWENHILNKHMPDK